MSEFVDGVTKIGVVVVDVVVAAVVAPVTAAAVLVLAAGVVEYVVHNCNVDGILVVSRFHNTATTKLLLILNLTQSYSFSDTTTEQSIAVPLWEQYRLESQTYHSSVVPLQCHSVAACVFCSPLRVSKHASSAR